MPAKVIKRNWLMKHIWLWRWNHAKCFKCGTQPVNLCVHTWWWNARWACEKHMHDALGCLDD